MTAVRLFAIAACAIALGASPQGAYADDGLLDAGTEDVVASEDGFAIGEISGYSEWDNAMQDAVASVSSEAVGDFELDDPIAVPEPSAFALLGGLAALLLAITLLRWHFDKNTAVPARVTGQQ